MKIDYIGALQDYSGYGEAGRNDVLALLDAGVEVNSTSIHYASGYSDFGDRFDEVRQTITNKQESDVRILHITPDQFGKAVQDEGAYYIGRVFWETDKLPPEFARGCDLVDEIWTGSKANKDAIESAGVKTPVYIIPQAINTQTPDIEPYQLEGFDGFVFYSIFEWTNRKGPDILLTSFIEEFSDKDDVALVIKSYHKGFNRESDRFIRREIRTIKSRCRKEDAPRVYLYTEKMDRDDIVRLHKMGDCFVSAHRGEGWGIPQVEATLYKNPVISTGYGGCHEYYTDKSMLRIPFKMTGVSGMEGFNSFYKPDQNWAEPDRKQLRKFMREVYEDIKMAKRVGSNGHNMTKRKFSTEAVGEMMKTRLSNITTS